MNIIHDVYGAVARLQPASFYYATLVSRRVYGVVSVYLFVCRQL